MAENNAVTKEDLQNTTNELKSELLTALDKVVVHLTKLIKETVRESAAATETKLTAEMDRRFAASKDDVIKRFRRAERKQQAFQKETAGQFHQLRSTVENRFDLAKQYTDETVVKEIRKVVTMLDGQAGMANDLKVEQGTLGVLYDQLERNLETSNKSNGVAITDLKQRVTALEEKVAEI